MIFHVEVSRLLSRYHFENVCRCLNDEMTFSVLCSYCFVTFKAAVQFLLSLDVSQGQLSSRSRQQVCWVICFPPFLFTPHSLTPSDVCYICYPNSSSSVFSIYFASNLHSPCSPVLCVFSLYSCLPHISCITSLRSTPVLGFLSFLMTTSTNFNFFPSINRYV